MKKILAFIFILVALVSFGQKSSIKPKPQFKLAGVDSGTITVSEVTVDKKLKPNSSELKIISFDITVMAQGMSVMEPTYGDSISFGIIGRISREVKVNGFCKMIIDNVKTKNQSGIIGKLNTPLILNIKKQ